MDQVSVGRIVRYVLACGRIVAAIVTEVFTDNTVSLTAFPPPSANDLAATVQKTDIAYDQSAAPGTWHWPQMPIVASNVADTVVDSENEQAPASGAVGNQEPEPVTLEKNVSST